MQQLGTNPSIDIRANLLHAWSGWAHDPASHAAAWLIEGSPAGITVDFQLDGVLEQVEPQTPLDCDTLSVDADTFSNYSGVEDDPEALSVIDGYIQKGWVLEYSSLDELRRNVQGEPVLNKFACIKKIKPDGTTKRRIIMDSKRSSVTDASKKMYKAVLPRATDLIHDSLSLIASAATADDVEILVSDAEDAFWQVPLHSSERRFYCSLLRRLDGSTSYLAYNRTAQGSRGAPLSWTVVFGLVCRCALSILRATDDKDSV